MQSVPEDTLATPSKAFPPGAALRRAADADSGDGSPKIHVGRTTSSTESSMQLSNIMTNQLFEQDSNGLAQEVPAAELTGEAQAHRICRACGDMSSAVASSHKCVAVEIR